jgi:hypothetical protein
MQAQGTVRSIENIWLTGDDVMAITAPVPLINVSEKSAVARILEKYFYFYMSVLIAVVVFYGFSHTVNKNLIHPAIQKPWILWVHGIVFSGWLFFFILQSALVRARSVRWHRNVGWFGAVLGASMVYLGVSTTLSMARFYLYTMHRTEANFLIVPFWDISCFAVCFALAIVWRKKPEHHRRMMLLATCALTAAGWGRIPFLSTGGFYAGVDFLLLLGIARDWIVNRRIHSVYIAGLPVFAAGQALALVVVITKPDWWMKFAFALVG